MNKVITIYNRKGGVAKTTTAFTLCWDLASRGYKVLALDLDSQMNFSLRLLNGAKVTGKRLIDIIISGQPIKAKDIQHRVIDEAGHSIDFIPSSLNISRIEARLPAGTMKEFLIADILREVSSEYDFIILDTPPSMELLNTAAIIAATDLIIPTTPKLMSTEGVDETLPIVRRMLENPHLHLNLNILAILVTRYPTRKVKTAEAEFEALKKKYGKLVVSTPVREYDAVEKAIKKNLPVIAYDPRCNASEDYSKVFKELYERIGMEV